MRQLLEAGDERKSDRKATGAKDLANMEGLAAKEAICICYTRLWSLPLGRLREKDCRFKAIKATEESKITLDNSVRPSKLKNKKIQGYNFMTELFLSNIYKHWVQIPVLRKRKERKDKV